MALFTLFANPDAELHDRLWQDAQPAPAMAFRGQMTTLPLYGGIPIYGDMFRLFEANDESTGNPFHDKDAWRRTFEDMEALRLNALVWTHPHPFPLFVDYEEPYEAAAWLSDEALAEKRAMLRWIIEEGRRHGVKCYFLIWNIWLPRDYAEARGLPQDGIDSPETRAYTESTVASFFRDFPGFGGLIVQAGESPPRCEAFVRNSIVPAMESVTPRPELIMWSWCSRPEDVRRVLDAYDGPRMAMEYLQYEQFFAEIADPRIGRMSEALGGMPMLALGGPKSSQMRLMAGSPTFIQSVVEDLYRNRNGRGLIAEALEWSEDRWLAKLVFARSQWQPTEPAGPGFWKDIIALRYGSAELAAPLYDLYEAASRIIPTQLTLTHSQSDHFMLQPGVFLFQLIAMPSRSTYIFENAQETDEHGILTPMLGLSFPNPEWGPYVMPIAQGALQRIPDTAGRVEKETAWLEARRERGFAPERTEGALPPETVIAELEEHVRDAERALAEAEASADSAVRNRDELAGVLQTARITRLLGEYLAAKDRAALAFETFRLTGDDAARRECLARLDESLNHWRAYAAAYDAKYPDGSRNWVSTLSSGPPWSQNDLWFSYVLDEGVMAGRTPLFEREARIVRQRLQDPPAALSPPLWDELQPLLDGETLARFDFTSADDPRFATGEAGHMPPDGAVLVADSTGREGMWHDAFETDPARLPMKPDTRYQVLIDYTVHEADGSTCLWAAFRSAQGGVAADRGVARTWGRPPGHTARRVFDATTGAFTDYRFVIGLRGHAKVTIDAVTIVAGD